MSTTISLVSLDQNAKFIELIPPAKPTIVRYRQWGSTGPIVLTLAVTYVGDDVETITRTFPA